MGKPCSTIWKKKEKKELGWRVIKAGGDHRRARVPRMASPGKAAASQTWFQLDRSQISHPQTSYQVKEISAAESHKPGSQVALGQAGFQLLVYVSSRTCQGLSRAHQRERKQGGSLRKPPICALPLPLPALPHLSQSLPLFSNHPVQLPLNTTEIVMLACRE